MLKLAVQITTLIAILILLILLAMGLSWQLVLLRTVASYLGLMILFYLCVLIFTILTGKVMHTDRPIES